MNLEIYEESARVPRSNRYLNSTNTSEGSRAAERRAIHANRVRRLIPALATQFRIDVGTLQDLAEHSLFLCAICIGPMPTPQLYRRGGEPRGLLCGRCYAAIEKCGDTLHLVGEHSRFRTDLIRTRARLGRYMRLSGNLSPEAEQRIAHEEKRAYVELLEEDQLRDPLVEDNVISFPVEATRRLVEQEVSDGEREAGHDPDE